jgi:hypothetical protein
MLSIGLAILVILALVILGVRKLQSIREANRLQEEANRLEQEAILRQKEATRRHRAARKHPLKRTMKTADKRPAYVQVRPTVGAVLQRTVLNELEEYVARLRRKDISRGLKVEYRNGSWHSRKDGKLLAPVEKDT